VVVVGRAEVTRISGPACEAVSPRATGEDDGQNHPESEAGADLRPLDASPVLDGVTVTGQGEFFPDVED
jgi:hypothetical protein